MALATSAASTAFRLLARSRKSTRRFDSKRQIPLAVMKDVLQTTLTSPSGFNLQPVQVIIIQAKDVKNQLAENAMLGAGNQYRIRDASAVAVFLCDLEISKRLPRIIDLEKKSGMRHPDYLSTLPIAASFLTGEGHVATTLKQISSSIMSSMQPSPTIDSVKSWGYKNSSLMAQTYVFAAESHGLATCMMEGFDVSRAKEVLRIPDRYALPLMVATGYEYAEHGNLVVEENEQRTPRLRADEVFFGDTFGAKLDSVPESLTPNRQ